MRVTNIGEKTTWLLALGFSVSRAPRCRITVIHVRHVFQAWQSKGAEKPEKRKTGGEG